jgi:uncharacterized membrane protein
MHKTATSVPSRFGYYLLVTLAAAGCVVATYLALYQMGIVAAVWEPLFGDGSRIILRSSLARSLPVPDAAIGAVAYLAEFLCATVRWTERARNVWVERAYYALVVTFTVGSMLLVALQWGYFHAWCTLCLTSALLSFIVAGVVISEFRARRG